MDHPLPKATTYLLICRRLFCLTPPSQFCCWLQPVLAQIMRLRLLLGV
jgi:hypothetical protein